MKILRVIYNTGMFHGFNIAKMQMCKPKNSVSSKTDI